jgi:TonB-linked SusC/RagA family outer membrane protein
MRKFTMLLALLIFIGLQAVNAQKTITGTITGAEDGAAIPGATVVVKNTTIGTTTNENGMYELSVPNEARLLVFSFVGMISKEVEIGGQSVINVVLEADIMDIEGVVVTALGITREKKALGYSVQDVKGEELEKAKENNIVNSLTGKVAGVQVVSASGAVGSSARVVIRGNNSFSENQPLWVVDGVPVSNFSSRVDQYGGQDFGNTAMDLDPANIESISVLKGANAAALYGSRAANGVILVTTKSAKKGASKGIGVAYSTSYQWENVSYLPYYQDKYGQGYAGDESYAIASGVNPDNVPEYEAWARANSFSYFSGDFGADGVNDGIDESWGPRLDIGMNIPQFDSPVTDPNNPLSRVATPWVSQPDNVKDFFETGHTWDNNLELTGGTDVASARLGLGYQNTAGAIPNTDLEKYTVNFSGNVQLSKRLNAIATVTYVENESTNLPGGGYDENNIMQSLGSWFGRQVNMQSLLEGTNGLLVPGADPEKGWLKTDLWGRPYNWNSNYHNNPYWTVYQNTTSRTRNRVFGNVALTYKITDWLNVMGRIGTDYWNEVRKHLTADGSLESSYGGAFWQDERRYQETNADLIFTADKDLSEDWAIRATLGANYMNRTYNYSSLAASELTVPDLFTISNVMGNPTVTQYDEERETNSVFGSVGISFRRMLYLDVTGRNDWSSTLPSDSWSYFYPSVGLSWVFTETFDIPANILTFGKIRGSWAKVGNGTEPYQLAPTFSSAQAIYGVAQYFYPRQLPPLNLEPEETVSIEVGTDLKFLNNRIGVDYTFYDKTSIDQIMAVNISSATGFNSMRLNAGEIRNWGHELMLTALILKSTKGLNWELTFNWSKNNSEIVELYGDLQAYQISRSWQTVTIEARPGEPWGVIRGKGFLRDDAGNIIVGENGIPKRTATPVNIGNINPDWIGGVRNTFDWNNFTLSFLFDFRKGGDVFSVTDWFGAYAGTTAETAVSTDEDYFDTWQDAAPWLKIPDGATGTVRETGLIVDGVYADGTPNTTVVSAEDYYESYWGLHEASIIDGSFLKFREFVLGYDFPKDMIAKSGFIKSLNLSVYGRNLALLMRSKSNDIKIDPETGFGTTNDGVGLEQYQLPPVRNFGVKLRVTF